MQERHPEGPDMMTTSFPCAEDDHLVQMVPDIRYALRHGCFIPYFQPLHDGVTGHCVGAEILARLPLPDGTLCLPGTFLPQLDTPGDLPVLTRSLLEKAGGVLSGVSLPPGFMLTFNVTADMAGEPWLAESCRRLRARLPDGVTLVAELTEQSPLTRDGPDWQRRLARLKADGVVVALDDFGTGHAGLHLLQQTGAGLLKIPREFVSGPGSEAMADSLTGTIRHLATRLGLTLIAEGVETRAQRDRLVRKGIILMQGWHFSPPLSGPAFRGFLRDESGGASRCLNGPAF